MKSLLLCKHNIKLFKVLRYIKNKLEKGDYMYNYSIVYIAVSYTHLDVYKRQG